MTGSNNRQNEKLMNLLKASQQDFRFDQSATKNRLMSSLDQTKIQSPQGYFFTVRFFSYSAIAVIFLALISSTLVFAYNAQPGDRLFGLNKFSEQIILSLPLSVEQKAKLETHIVTQRLQALQMVNAQGPLQSENKKLETIKESDESLEKAINIISANKQKLESEGNMQSANKLGVALTVLDTLAQKHENEILAIESGSKDNESKDTIEKHLHRIKIARQKVQLELHEKTENDTKGSETPSTN